MKLLVAVDLTEDIVRLEVGRCDKLFVCMCYRLHRLRFNKPYFAYYSVEIQQI
uniref:Transposase n=1 Tax=Panagrellus redivivus TaxID=6233 RepID=A0A7E4ZYK0_PANRE